MKNLYTFHSKFLLRTPLIPLKNGTMDENQMFNFSQQPFFKEAIYLASPVLYDEMIKWHSEGPKDSNPRNKLVTSLYKYYSRMQTRCTPYGLFAACSIAEWDSTTKITIDNTTSRHTRLDMNYLCALVQELNCNPSIFPYLTFYPNNSIYKIANTYRYIEYHYIDSKRIHQISSVEYSSYLQNILEVAANGSKITELANTLICSEISEGEALAFITELIENQILVSELEPSLTGSEFIYQILEKLKRISEINNSNEINNIIINLESCNNQINQLDQEIGNPIENYRVISRQLHELNTKIEENQLFQTDLYRNLSHSTLNSDYQINLIDALDFLNKCFPQQENSNLKNFRENFYTQYEDSEVPMLIALDTESGVGYPAKDTAGVNYFLDDLVIPKSEKSSTEIIWNKTENYLHDKLCLAIKNNLYTVQLSSEEFDSTEFYSTTLPDTIPIMFRIVENGKIFFQNAGGSSSANLIARFAHGNNEINNLLTEIAIHEQNLNPDKILAEILHLPESRIGNILLRPSIRKYELPYLGKSNLPQEYQIAANDLYISIRNKKIILRSKKLNKEIIPRLSSAHNFSYNSLPVYQFLCDLQTQYFEKAAFGFTWGALSEKFKFLPRAEYKNIILERAKWQLSKEDFRILNNWEKHNNIIDINNWRNQWNIPEFVLLSDGDNELFVNFNSILSIKMFISAIKNKERIVLLEYLNNQTNSIIKDETGNSYSNEFIAILKRNNQNIINRTDDNENINTLPNYSREEKIDQKWIYYKIYCGIKTADKLLVEQIKPLVEELLDKKLIEKFFFIRYADPETHLRIRFLLSNKKDQCIVQSFISNCFDINIKQGTVFKIQTDIYFKEIERYGRNSIELSESLFFIDSTLCLEMLAHIDDTIEGSQIKWKFALKSIDWCFSIFFNNNSEKLNFWGNLKESFLLEHSTNKTLRVQLDSKYRKSKIEIENILKYDSDKKFEGAKMISELTNIRNIKTADSIFNIINLSNNGELGIEKTSLIASHIHMMVNRIFRSRQRTYEMVLYYFLYRYYKSIVEREKSTLAFKNTK